MANFCMHCGSPLEEGQVCSCPAAQAAAHQPYTQPQQPQAPYQQPYQPQQPQAPKAPSPVGSAFKNLLPFLKAYLRSPVKATRSAVAQNDIILAVILLCFQLIAAGLVMFSFLYKICSTVKDFALSAMGLAGLSGGFFGSGPSISPSFFLSLIYGILAAAIAIVIFGVLIFVIAKIVKTNCSIKDVLIACGANSMFVTVLLVVTFLLFFVSFTLGFIFFLLSMLTWICLGIPTVQALGTGTETGKFWISYIVVVLVALLAGGWISSKFCGLSVRSIKISYAGESVKVGQMIDGMGGLDMNDLLEDMMDSIF